MNRGYLLDVFIMTLLFLYVILTVWFNITGELSNGNAFTLTIIAMALSLPYFAVRNT